MDWPHALRYTRFGIQLVRLRQDGAIFACMMLCGAHVANATVLVVMVIPIDKVADPTACVVDVGESLGRELGSVLSRTEKRFDRGVVVTDPGAVSAKL